MLKKENRIFSRKEFGDIKARGTLFRGRNVSVLVVDKKDEERRIGIIVSKKVSKKAVERNKIRRLVYTSVKENWELIKNGWRLVFLANQQLVGKKYEKINFEVLEVLQKIHF